MAGFSKYIRDFCHKTFWVNKQRGKEPRVSSLITNWEVINTDLIRVNHLCRYEGRREGRGVRL